MSCLRCRVGPWPWKKRMVWRMKARGARRASTPLLGRLDGPQLSTSNCTRERRSSYRRCGRSPDRFRRLLVHSGVPWCAPSSVFWPAGSGVHSVHRLPSFTQFLRLSARHGHRVAHRPRAMGTEEDGYGGGGPGGLVER